MKSKLLKGLTILLSVFLLGYAGYQVWQFFYHPYQTEITVTASVNESIHVSGLAVRTETLIESDYGGSVSYVFEDAARVLKNKPIAYTHSSADTVNKMTQVSDLEKKISNLKEASSGVAQLYGSSEFINDQIRDAVLIYSKTVNNTNLGDFGSVKDNLLLAINKKTALTGKTNYFEERILILQSEKDELEAEINADEAETVLSPKNGYFISEIDGFENLINKEMIDEMTVAELESIINRDVVTVEQKVGKIADNHKWYYLIAVSEEEAARFSEGKKLEVNFDGISHSFDFTVDRKIKDDTSEKTIIVLLCKTLTSEVASLRQINADVIFSTTSGLRVSSDAVRFDGSQNIGVYILDREEVKFRKIDILYTGTDYLIVRWNAAAKDSLQLFDEVFVGGSDLYVGKIVS